jgi:hypothetical protein
MAPVPISFGGFPIWWSIATSHFTGNSISSMMIDCNRDYVAVQYTNFEI